MVSIQQLLAKVDAYIEGLAGLTRGQLQMRPPPVLAQDYNQLRALFLEVFPKVDERLIGPLFQTAWDNNGEVCPSDYAALQVFTLQLRKQIERELKQINEQLFEAAADGFPFCGFGFD